MRNFSLLFVLMILVSSIFAQDVTIPNVSPKVKKYKGVQAVEDLGYYCFVMDEKSKKGYKLFTLYIWDFDLNQIAKSTLELEKKSEIVDAVYNGSHFLVVFYDRKKDNVRSVSFNSNGDKIADEIVDGIRTMYMAVDDMRPSYYSAGEGGFYGIVPDKVKKFGFSVTRYDNELNELWVNAYFPDKGVQVVMDAKSSDDKLIVLKYSKASKLTKVTIPDMTAFDANTGDELWTYDLGMSDRVLLPTEVAINKKGNVAVAGMYFDGLKVKGINSDGIFFAHVSATGEELAMNSQPWDGELQRFLKDAKNSITVGKPKVIFEDIVYEESSNSFRVVGELFTMGTLGKVLSMLGGGGDDAETKISIEDLIVFTFTGDGALADMYSVNKARTHIYIPATYAGGMRIAQAMKQTGSLPFKFTGEEAGGDAVAFFIDYVKTDEEGNLISQKIAKSFGQPKLGLGMLNLNRSSADGAEVRYLPLTKKTDKIDEKSDVEFDSKRAIITATKSKPGFVLISEFNKRTENLNLFLEEIQ